MSESEGSLASRRLRPVDLLVLGYLCVASIAAMLQLARRPAAMGALLLAHVLTVVMIVLVTRPGLGVLGRALREIYPLVLLLGLYSELDIINAGRPVYDAVVQHWEALLFGGQPSRDWWRHAPSAFWSFVLHGAYLTYYPIVAVPPFVLAATGNLTGLRRYVRTVMLAFIVCYCWFLFFPVAGPYYAFARPDGEFVANPAARAVYSALAQGSSYGAAFPSSHVAATVAAVLASWRASRAFGVVLAIPAAFLMVAVVYCQMHYAVDAVAGLMVGVAAAWVGMADRA